jgi:hypothetical protein
MSDLSPLSGVKWKLDFGAVRAAFDPSGTLAAKKIESLTCSVVDAVALADVDDLAVEGHLIVGLGHVVFPLLADVAGAGTTAVLWIGKSVPAQNCCKRDGIDKKERPPALPQAAQV